MSDRPHDALIALIAPLLITLEVRKTFVASAFSWNPSLITRLNYDLDAQTFSLHLCQRIAPDNDGKLLDALLVEVARRKGHDALATLTPDLPRLRQWLKGGAPDAIAPKLRVFLSYARADDAGSDRAAYADPAR
ncbi:MAG: hypothetical protein SGI73_15440, partial [Chloroflexota bacterium]|nr:hypothetical protein [Chloroflexota bacterium]